MLNKVRYMDVPSIIILIIAIGVPALILLF